MNEVKRIPIEELKLQRIWTNWSYLVTKDGKQTKKPHCKVNDSNTWITFEQASGRCNAQNIGIGILFAEHETGYLICGVDIDAHNVDVNPLTKEILDMFKDTYIEKSPSGKGYHILFLVKSDAVPQNYKELYKQKNSTLDVECYLGGMTSRYFTFTGNRQSECDYLTDMTNTWLAFLDKYMSIPKKVDDTQQALSLFTNTEPLDIDNRLNIARNAKNGALFSSLWNGDIENYPSKSEAVLAFMNLLVFYFGEYGEDVVRNVYMTSSMAEGKWAERSQIIDSTIKRAFESVTSFYTPKREKTTHNVSVGADIEQSIQNTTDIISQNERKNNPFHTISMEALYENVYTKNPPIIECLLYQGAYLFVGSPKIGKSFFMAQLAYHVSTGTTLWNYPVRQGTVLYLALEDDYRRLQERMYRMFGTESTENLHFCVRANYLNEGLLEQLKGFIKEHSDTSLVIIDTLQKIREVDSDSYSYAKDYEIISQLKCFADSNGICLLIVHHTRKQKSSDNFDMISGTNGLLGCADGAFMLYKEKRTSNKATLEISGRDQQDQKIKLVRDEEKLCWNFEKSETQLWKEPPEPLLEDIAKLVTEDNPTWQGSASDLVTALYSELKPNKLTMKLNVIAGRLENDYNISYTTKRTNTGRVIILAFKSDDSDGCDD